MVELYGVCRICGEIGSGTEFNNWVRDTFTNYDHLFPGEIICSSCAFWFDQRSVELQVKMGKDKPQRMQNYSHFVVDGMWIPLSKSNKAEMKRLLLEGNFPELAAIADSGQKHLAFRANRNPTGQESGWVQFEETSVYVERGKLEYLLVVIEDLYRVFSKGEIESGSYGTGRILEFGIEAWRAADERLKPFRAASLFKLAIFLAQRSVDDGHTGAGGFDGDTAEDDLEGDIAGLQKQVQNDDLGAVRERDQIGGVYKQPSAFCQPTLFEVGGDVGN